MSITVKEKRELIALLEEDYPDVESVAEAVYDLVERQIRERFGWVAVAIHPSLDMVQVIGVWNTLNQARKNAPLKMARYDDLSRFYLTELKDANKIEV